MTTQAEGTRIGFVGAGMMGHGICVNLLTAGRGDRLASEMLEPAVEAQARDN